MGLQIGPGSGTVALLPLFKGVRGADCGGSKAGVPTVRVGTSGRIRAPLLVPEVTTLLLERTKVMQPTRRSNPTQLLEWGLNIFKCWSPR